MWQTGTRYDAEELHARNQLKHGSWVLKIQTLREQLPCQNSHKNSRNSENICPLYWQGFKSKTFGGLPTRSLLARCADRARVFCELTPFGGRSDLLQKRGETAAPPVGFPFPPQ